MGRITCYKQPPELNSAQLVRTGAAAPSPLKPIRTDPTPHVQVQHEHAEFELHDTHTQRKTWSNPTQNEQYPVGRPPDRFNRPPPPPSPSSLISPLSSRLARTRHVHPHTCQKPSEEGSEVENRRRWAPPRQPLSSHLAAASPLAGGGSRLVSPLPHKSQTPTKPCPSFSFISPPSPPHHVARSCCADEGGEATPGPWLHAPPLWLTMDEYRPRRSPASERFIGMFASPSSSPTEPSFVAGDELHEDDFLFSSSPAAPPSSARPGEGPGSPSRVPQGQVGLLAALHEGDKRLLLRRGGGGGGGAAAAAAASAGTLLRRKATIAAAAASASGGGGSLSPTQSPTSAARAIPMTPRPKSAGPAAPYHQSAPVKVPARPPRRQEMFKWDELDDDDFLRNGDAAMLPPHEMVARASAGGAGPAAPFSMLEGAGRTLKGRDLRRVRDAVLRQTGFLDWIPQRWCGSGFLFRSACSVS